MSWLDDEAFVAQALAYLDGELDGEALARFDAALVAEPERARALRVLAERAPLLAAIGAPAARPARGWLLAAAGLLLAALAALAWLAQPPAGGGQPIASSTPSSPTSAPPAVVVLPSGHRVTALGAARWRQLGPDRIELSAGELEVDSRPSSKPLTISTRAVTVLASGALTMIAVDDRAGDSSMPNMTRALVLAGLVTLTNLHGTIDGRSGDVLAGEPEAPPKALVQSTNDFGLALYRKLAADADGNLACSPYSVHAALTMLLEGARGETRAELARALRIPAQDGKPSHLTWTTARVRGGLTALRRQLVASSGKGAQLEVANRAYIEASWPLRPEMTRALEGHESALVGADFRNHPLRERERINAWVAKRTLDRVKQLLPSDAISSETRFCLLNAVTFLGTWARPFDPKQTKPRDFTLASGEKVQVPTMFRSGEGTRKDPLTWVWASREQLAGGEVDLVALPYLGGQLVMSLLIPEHGKLGACEQALTSEWMTRAHRALRPKPHYLALPRFDVAGALDLEELLPKLGVERVFNPRQADLSGFSERAGGLYVDTAVHQAAVKIDEEGTVAVAGTAVAGSKWGGIRTIRADRPFLFMIRDRKTGALLFMGRVTDPR